MSRLVQIARRAALRDGPLQPGQAIVGRRPQRDDQHHATPQRLDGAMGGGWMGGGVEGWARRGARSLLQLTTERTSAVRSNAYGGTPDGSGLPAMAVSYTRSEWPSCNRVGGEVATRTRLEAAALCGEGSICVCGGVAARVIHGQAAGRYHGYTCQGSPARDRRSSHRSERRSHAR